MQESSGKREEAVERGGILDGEGSNDWAEFDKMNKAGTDVNAGSASEDDAGGHPCFAGYQDGPEMTGSPMDSGEDMSETDRDGELEK